MILPTQDVIQNLGDGNQILAEIDTSFFPSINFPILKCPFLNLFHFVYMYTKHNKLRAGSFVTRVFPEFRNSAENSPYIIVPVLACVIYLICSSKMINKL